jgi:hypothetical protein
MPQLRLAESLPYWRAFETGSIWLMSLAYDLFFSSTKLFIVRENQPLKEQGNPTSD